MQGRLIFRRDKSGGIEEVRGGEASPIVQQVVFDGKPRDNNNANVIVWKQTGPRNYERTLSDKQGGLITTRRLRVSEDGKTLVEETDQKTTDGRMVTTTANYRRESGEANGIVAHWQIVAIKSTAPEIVTYERSGSNGLKASDSSGQNYILTMDDKSSVVNGPGQIIGTMVAAKLSPDGRTIEHTWSRKGTVTARSTLTLSPDGKSFTFTYRDAGPNASAKPDVSVFVKQ